MAKAHISFGPDQLKSKYLLKNISVGTLVLLATTI
jgi:hypothetical protein